MRIGVAMTVSNRPRYFSQVLDAWSHVRHVDKVEFLFGVEPTRGFDKSMEMITGFASLNRADVSIRLNPEKFGSQHNPWAVMDRSFKAGCDYVILAEDDLLPSTDLLEYHQWAAARWGTLPLPLMVCSFNDQPSDDLGAVHAVPGFANVLVWGTWRHRWDLIISPTWDHNYSTGDGLERGWDWNLNKRVAVPCGAVSLQPAVSRVQNIGAIGTNSPKGAPYVQAQGWMQDIQPTNYRIEYR